MSGKFLLGKTAHCLLQVWAMHVFNGLLQAILYCLVEEFASHQIVLPFLH